MHYSEETSSDDEHKGEPTKIQRPRTPMAATPSTNNTKIENEIEAKYWIQKADDLNTYTTILAMMDEDKNEKESCPSEVEFAGNSLVSVYEEALSESINNPTDKEILLDTWPEGIEEEYISMEERERIKARKDIDYTMSNLNIAEDDIYHLKKRIARFEGREGTVFLALDSLARRITKLTEMVTADNLEKHDQVKEDEIMQTKIKDIAHEIEIKTLKTLVKKQSVRLKEMERQLETVQEASWKNGNIWRENYERLEEELESTRTELHHLMFTRRRDEHTKKNPLLED